MKQMRSTLCAAALAAVGAGGLALPVHGGEATGTVLFRVTLSGPVPNGDSFGVYRVSSPAQWLESHQMVCNPPDWSQDPRAQQPTCEATTYETSVSGSVGAHVEYALLRDPAGEPIAFEQHQDGSLLIEPGTQVVELTWTYASTPPTSGTDGGGGADGQAQGGAPPTGTSVSGSGAGGFLPNTAVPLAGRP